MFWAVVLSFAGLAFTIWGSLVIFHLLPLPGAHFVAGAALLALGGSFTEDARRVGK